MDRQRRVILYGKSVILGTLGASLARYPDLDIVTLSPLLPGVEGLGALEPDVIIFDVDAGRPEAAFSLLKDRPHLLLVGVSPENEQVKLWSSANGRVVTAADLLQLIIRPNAPQEEDRSL